MNGVLNVSTGKLTSTAASFQSTGSTVNNLTQQMTGIVTSLSGQIWSGSAATRTLQSLTDFRMTSGG